MHITPEVVSAHNLTPEEFARIKSLMGREPTFAELGMPGIEGGPWFGLFAPANTPNDIRHKVAKDVAAFVTLPEVLSRLAQLGIDPANNSPEDFAKMISSEITKYAQVAKRAGIEPE